MALENIFSHPFSRNYPNGKPLLAHTNGVSDKAFLKYNGPEEYRKYLRLICVFHDLGKLNPNFQAYLFGVDVKGFKNHAYLSAITGLMIILKNKDRFFPSFDMGVLSLCIVLIAKHHGHLIDVFGLDENLNYDELERVLNFFKREKEIAEEYIRNVNEFVSSYSELKIKYKLNLNDFEANFVLNAGTYLKKMLQNTADNKKLEYYIVTQYLFSCLIEGDKRDASDNDKFLINLELKEFLPDYFEKKLNQYYESFKNFEQTLSEDQLELNKVRSEIRNECVRKVKKELKKEKRVFQIISPTGSGKTLTFLSVASEIKKFNSKKDLKFIYALPFLSITDQITKECEKIFFDKKQLIYRIDSAGETVIDTTGEPERSRSDFDMNEDIELSIKDFSENIFDHAFIITTFVKLFETLTSNRNKTLLRFNNFSNSIIVIDEIQSLPPRTYTFLIAFITKFAELFNCYLIIGSATVPHFDFSDDNAVLIYRSEGQVVNFKDILSDYKPPINLLESYKKVYSNENFSRYKLRIEKNIGSIEDLGEIILNSAKSNLAILNTKKASLKLYTLLRKGTNGIYLLNTNQTLIDRRRKLNEIIMKLKRGEKVHLISTQLIEAGIDISFPIVYRDMAPFPSIIQSAGRCNRSKEVSVGEMIVLMLKNEKNEYYHSQVYKDELVSFTKSILNGFNETITENELLEFQDTFFKKVKDNLAFGEFELYKSENINGDKSYRMPVAIRNFEFGKLGQFKLINNKQLEEISLFVMQTDKDVEDWTNFKSMFDLTMKSKDRFEKMIELRNLKENLSNRIVSVNLNDFRKSPVLFSMFKEREIFGLSYLEPGIDVGVNYSAELGLTINNFQIGEFI